MTLTRFGLPWVLLFVELVDEIDLPPPALAQDVRARPGVSTAEAAFAVRVDRGGGGRLRGI